MKNTNIEETNTVDVESFNEAQISDAIQELSDQINSYVDETCSKANALLAPYGMKAKMRIVILSNSQE